MPNRLVQLLLVSTMVLVSCKDKTSKVDDLGRANAPAQTTAPLPPSAAADAPSIPPSNGKIHQGTILEAIDVTNYTYLRYRDPEGLEHWAAVLKGTFEVGKEVKIVESLVQKNFTSPSLKRTFDSIVFGNVVGTVPTAEVPAANADRPAGHPPTDNADGNTLPEGHPPVDAATPMKDMQLPKGHPPISKDAM